MTDYDKMVFNYMGLLEDGYINPEDVPVIYLADIMERQPNIKERLKDYFESVK